MNMHLFQKVIGVSKVFLFLYDIFILKERVYMTILCRHEFIADLDEFDTNVEILDSYTHIGHASVSLDEMMSRITDGHVVKQNLYDDDKFEALYTVEYSSWSGTYTNLFWIESNTLTDSTSWMNRY